MDWKFHGNATLPKTNFPSYGWTQSLEMKDFSSTDLTDLCLQTLAWDSPRIPISTALYIVLYIYSNYDLKCIAR